MTYVRTRARLDELLRIWRILFVERRLPVRVYQFYFNVLNNLGIRFATRKSRNGLTVRGYTNSFFMFYEVWSKKDYDIPGFAFTRDMTVIDIGANQGFFSLYAASQGATVYAFEPCEDNLEILHWNVSKNGFQRSIKIVNAAVTDRQGEVDLFVGFDSSGSVISGAVTTRDQYTTGTQIQARAVKSVTLDSLLDEFHIERCDFLKMDCEGAEYEILASTSRESFSRIARISMECHENRVQEAIAILKNVGFEIVYERWGYLGLVKATNTRLSA
jgi:FkbM family methyltransferase